ncbi:MAG: hypothetical protein AB8B89_04135 [Gammaproteobacteria bacterium]
MRFINIYVFLLLGLWLASVSMAEDTNSNSLKRNPFAKPSQFNVVGNADENIDVNNNLVLKATLVSSGSGSVANINGEMIMVGQKINNYELVSVDIGSAVLIANGKEKRLIVNDNYKDIR